MIGSLGVVGTAAVMVVNRYTTLLSEDDSTLSTTDFAATWILMSISGFFSTLGSLAFVRAFHEDPPMTPLFTWYHLQSDELLASWLFFCATVPFVPYCLIFLQSDGFNSLLFLAALGFSIVACLGTLLFVRACYPSDRVRLLYRFDYFFLSPSLDLQASDPANFKLSLLFSMSKLERKALCQ